MHAAGSWRTSTGDGYDDLVPRHGLQRRQEGPQRLHLLRFADGLTEARRQLLPAPACTAVTAGDFDGDGRLDLAFLCAGSSHYYQTVPASTKRYVDLEFAGKELAAHDLDGDGFADLVVRLPDGQMTVYWGGARTHLAGHSNGCSRSRPKARIGTTNRVRDLLSHL